MGKKIPQMTVQLIAAIAISLTMVMVIENYFSIRLSEILQISSLLFQRRFWELLRVRFGLRLQPGFQILWWPWWVGSRLFYMDFYRSRFSLHLWLVLLSKPLDVQNKQDWFYVAGVVFLIQLVISFVLTPLALHIHYGTPWIALYSIRLVKAVFEIPLEF